MAKVVLLWPQRPPRAGWSASLLYETVEGTALTELFTITRLDRSELEATLREVCPGVQVAVLEQARPT
jgi:hypothetical protein